MNLQELENQIIVIESDDILQKVYDVLVAIPYLKNDLLFVKSRLDKLS